jgi:hypothetical protein
MRLTLPLLILVCTASLILAGARAGAQDGTARPSTAQAADATTVPRRIGELLSAAGVDLGEGAQASDAARARSHREVRVAWEAFKASDKASASDRAPASATSAAQSANAPGRVRLASAAESRGGGLPKQRSAELSSDQLMIVAVDSGGRLRWWGLVADPRIVRAEWPGENGELTGQVLYRESAEFVLQYPDDGSITELRLFHPDWDGESFSLKPLGSVNLIQ